VQLGRGKSGEFAKKRNEAIISPIAHIWEIFDLSDGNNGKEPREDGERKGEKDLGLRGLN